MELLALVALAFALVAWRRTRRLAELEGRIRSLELVIAEGSARHDAAAAEPPVSVTAPPRTTPPPAPVVPPPPAVPAPPPAPPRAPREPKAARASPSTGSAGSACAARPCSAASCSRSPASYFFQYSIEHGLIPPWLRVVIGTAVGIGCVAGAELRAAAALRGDGQRARGGGIVVLYAAFWAARVALRAGAARPRASC